MAAELRLQQGVRLRRDAVRDRWILLAPERGYVLNHAGAAVVRAIVEGGPVAAEAKDFIDALLARRLLVHA